MNSEESRRWGFAPDPDPDLAFAFVFQWRGSGPRAAGWQSVRVMAALLDSEVVEALIEDGRRRDLSSKFIAEQIVALVDHPAWAKAMAHPARGAVSSGFCAHRATQPDPGGSARGTRGAVARQHLVSLPAPREAGFDRGVKTIPRRGAIEHVYRLTIAADWGRARTTVRTLGLPAGRGLAVRGVAVSPTS